MNQEDSRFRGNDRGEKMIILKNAYVVTLNPDDEFGRYSMYIGEGKILDMIKHDESKDNFNDELMNKYRKWTDQASGKAEVIDCTDKLIMPALVNSCLKSESSLVKYLLRKRRYEDSRRDLCTDFIFNYIYQEMPTDEIKQDLEIIYKYSFNRNLKSGVASLNEVTPRKDVNHLEPISKAGASTGQNISVCFPIKQEIKGLNDSNYFYYLTDENQLTIYDLSMLSELKSGNMQHLYIEAATNKEVTDKFKQMYNKPVIVLLDEYGLVDERTSLINPLYLTYEEIKILSEKRANIIICPSDLVNFTNRYFPLDDFLSHNIRFSIATGWLGEDLFQEIRIFRDKYKELNISNADFLMSVTQTPASLYFGDGDESYYLDTNKRADMIFVELSDLRFQFLPENIQFDKICDFLVDAITPSTISDILINGKFRVRAHRIVNADEEEIIKLAEETRSRLYKAGKYEEIQKRTEERKNIEELDLRGRDDEEIKLFSDTGAAAGREEEQREAAALRGQLSPEEEFRIKGKMPLFKHKSSKLQKNLFEDPEIKQPIESQEYQETPQLNLLYSELDESKNIEEEIIQAKMAETRILKQSAEKKRVTSPAAESESKIELPKNVKLKFGED